ncbi:MAG: hypothetical protein IJB94_05515 [Clostridia bacterium]|nr:hypothetical protein [Clostridia bacterium]
MKKTRILSALLLVAVLCGTLSSCVFLFRFGDKKPWTEDKIPETFFDADYLAERGVADFPLPPLEGAYLDPEKNILYLNLSRTEYEDYAELIAAYLRGKEDFPVKGFHCGNDDHYLMFLPMKEYQFASLDVDDIPYVKENERLFVFSTLPLGETSYDGATEIKKPTHVLLKWRDSPRNVDEPYTAEMTFPDLLGKSEFLSCYHGHDFDEMTYPVPGTVLTTTIRTCTRCGEEEREGYGYGTEPDEFSYTVVKGTEHLVSGMHASYWRGSLVEIALKAPESGDLKMTANGTEIPKVKEIDGQWIYAFIMPYGSIEITIEAVEHEHTGRWLSGEVAHWYEYTCGCPSPDVAELHLDGDNNGLCDICAYMVGVKQYYSLMMNAPEWLYEELKHTYYEGETVSVKISMATDVGFLFFVNGEEITDYQDVDGLYWEFTFEMPACETYVHFKTYDGFLPDWNYAVLMETYYRQNLDAPFVHVRHYYGEFASGAIVAMLDTSAYTDALWDETIGDTVIHYRDGNRIVALCPNNKFYTLTEAFENGYLTAEDIAAIAEMHNHQ